VNQQPNTPIKSSPAQDPRRRRRFWLSVGLLIGVWTFALAGVNQSPQVTTVPLGQALEKIEAAKVSEALVDDSRRIVFLTLKEGGKIISAGYPEGYATKLADALAAADVELNVRPVPQASFLGTLFTMLFPILLLVGLLLFFAKRSASGGGGPLGIGKLSAKKNSPVEAPTTRFSDVAGLDETVDELREIVELLADPDRYARLGAKPSRGFLLVGPPGTGKTLLAKAVAGEAGVPFFALSGSDFTEMFVGVGASRVRDLFAKARAQAPSIIFVDEIDSVARRRGNHNIGSNDERENTLNQLLAELDGFESRDVIFLGATNRVDILDPALLRPGRFDRKIYVPLPDRNGRESILGVHSKGKPLSADVDLHGLARRTPGFSGADLAYLVNEAALEAARSGADAISAVHMQAALATSVLGKERRSALVTDRDRRIVAWHEAGHTAAALLLPDAENPVTVTIIPRGSAGGVTWMGGSEHDFLTRAQANARLVVSMGGRAAEKILLGGDFTQGAHGDLQSATVLATEMVARYGMGRRLVSVDLIPGSTGSDVINEEAAELIAVAAGQSDRLLTKNRALVEAIAEALLESETLDEEQLLAFYQAHIRAPRRRVKPPVKVSARTARRTPELDPAAVKPASRTRRSAE
jgi:cell division protease FtsH